MSHRLLRTLSLVALMAVARLCTAQAEEPPREIETQSAPVELDGRVLFSVRGVAAYPAERRATAILSRIESIAGDPAMDPARIQVVESEQTSDVMLDKRLIVSVTDADAQAEGLDRRPLAAACAERVRQAITDYRLERSGGYLRRAALVGVVATLLFAAALWLVILATRRLSALADKRSRALVEAVAIQQFRILEGERIWRAISMALRTLRYVLVVVLAYLYLQAVLDLFPWTRPVSHESYEYIAGPVKSLWQGFVAGLPDLVVLAILVLVVRYLLRFMRLFFDAVGRGGVRLRGFERDWATPTYHIARFIVVLFTAVIAYPYIPGSGSEGFKGISLLLGVMLSIGSTSLVSNVIAGYALIYRRVLKVGDWVTIDNVLGQVTHTRVQVTHLRTIKNEEVTVPNSVIVNSKVTNYTALSAKGGLILHTKVGIGYEVPWRQVEAMLLLAAERTPGLRREPAPFVLQTGLEDFAVTYELNVHCDDPSAMIDLYSALHRRILDVFNEYGVQIMTPAYMGDPAEPKVVTKERWHTEPAQPVEPTLRASA